MNQRQRKQRLKWWEAILTAIILIPFVPILIALVLVVLLLQLATSICLHIIIWFWWCLRGKDILFVYSDSTIWHDYIEEHMLPHLQGRAVGLELVGTKAMADVAFDAGVSALWRILRIQSARSCVSPNASSQNFSFLEAVSRLQERQPALTSGDAS